VNWLCLIWNELYLRNMICDITYWCSKPTRNQNSLPNNINEGVRNICYRSHLNDMTLHYTNRQSIMTSVLYFFTKWINNITDYCVFVVLERIEYINQFVLCVQFKNVIQKERKSWNGGNTVSEYCRQY
jgi:hypothetical protein